MNKALVYIILFLFPVLNFAQSDKDKDQQEVYRLVFLQDWKQARQFIDSRFIKSKSKSKEVIGNVYLAFYYSLEEKDESTNNMVRALIDAKKIAMQTGNELDMAYVDYGYALYYELINKPELFIKSFNRSIKIFKSYPHENFIITLLYDVKKRYIWKNPLEKEGLSNEIISNKYALKTNNNLLIYSTYHDLATFYERQYSSSENLKFLINMEDNLKKGYQYAINIKDPQTKLNVLAIHYIHYGMLMTHRNQFSQALHAYKMGLQYNKGILNSKIITFILYSNIAQLYTRMNNNGMALEYYSKANNIIKNHNEIFNSSRMILYKATFYTNIAGFYTKINQPDTALTYTKMAYILMLQENKRQFENNIKSLDIYYKTEEKNRLLEENNKNLIKFRIFYICIITLALAVVVFLFFLLHYRQKFIKERTTLFESEKTRIGIEQELLKSKQEHLYKQILAKSLQLDHKNTFINELKENIKDNKKINIENILKNEQFTDNDFNSIQTIIQETHPNFFKRLSEVSKNKLTNLDMKYAAYIYLNMDNIQISNILKVDPKTVSITKYRLKQKIGLRKGDDLQIFIRNLEL
ncbi:hypothetical protein CMT84_05630 [Elizabethkingia anophelis]|nr:hypothetical protein [Elizabethkingia anophelis]